MKKIWEESIFSVYMLDKEKWEERKWELYINNIYILILIIKKKCYFNLIFKHLYKLNKLINLH